MPFLQQTGALIVKGLYLNGMTPQANDAKDINGYKIHCEILTAPTKMIQK